MEQQFKGLLSLTRMEKKSLQLNLPFKNHSVHNFCKVLLITPSILWHDLFQILVVLKGSPTVQQRNNTRTRNPPLPRSLEAFRKALHVSAASKQYTFMFSESLTQSIYNKNRSSVLLWKDKQIIIPAEELPKKEHKNNIYTINVWLKKPFLPLYSTDVQQIYTGLKL